MTDSIESVLREDVVFEPSPEFQQQANANDPATYDRAEADWLAWWESWANKLDWFQEWDDTLDWQPPFAKWFVGGKLNACHNCVDRHVEAGRGDRTALIAIGEPGDVRNITYGELKDDVSKLANALKELGIEKGDRVCIYMPMVAELCMAMLACARIGAPHSVVFGGFSSDSLVERINDADCKLVITADGGWRRGQIVKLKEIVDEALADGKCPSVAKCLVLDRIGEGAQMQPDRDVAWADIVPRQSAVCPCEPMDSEDLLYILYTSGSTGKPKGIMHTTGGYMTGVMATTKLVFDLKDEDVFWCTADCGWVTGHSYVVYGPMANCATQVIYEGAPDFPEKDRFWKIIESQKVSVLYTAPTAIRAFMKWGRDLPDACDLSSLRLLGSVGEPINPEAWLWYREVIGGGNCPVVDTWWQTETGAIMITPLPGIVPTKPGSATKPFPGIEPAVYDEEGNEIRGAGTGVLVLKRPWPSMLRGIYGDPERYKQTYWSRFDGVYFPGDGVKRDDDGYLWLLGRVDDVMLVAGHNISTMEVESALVDHMAVAEAAVIGKPHEIKGQGIAAFVILKSGHDPSEALAIELKEHVATKIGKIARPDDLIFTADVPKTRSGKIMRRLLRDVAAGVALGDTTTLADPAVVHALKERYESSES